MRSKYHLSPPIFQEILEKWILDEKSNNITVNIVFAVISSRFCRKIEKISLRSQYHLSPPIFQEILKTWISDEKSNNITVKNRFCRNIEPFCREIEKLSSSSNYHVSPRAVRARAARAARARVSMQRAGGWKWAVTWRLRRIRRWCSSA